MLTEAARAALRAAFPSNQVYTDAAALVAYEVDAGLDRGSPEGIVLPCTVEDVVRLVEWAAAYDVPLVARGAGTGLSGGAVAERGGIIVAFSRMNSVLEIDTYGRGAIAEPCVINLSLDEQVKAHGLYFPPDPASQRASTLGGNVAENSGGPHCFKYGVTTNYVTGMDVVLADGRYLRIGGRALDYPAYDLCGLLTGSEGMLALITAISVRLVRNPPAVKTMLAVFDSLEQAGEAVSAVIAAGLVPAAMELMDQKIIRIVEPFAHAGLPIDANTALIIEVDGYPASLDAQVNEIAGILQAYSAHDLRVAHSVEERNAIWLARKSVAGAVTRLTPSYYTVDVTVPRSRLAETLGEINQLLDRYGLRAGHLAHAGDGNLHPMILVADPHDRELMERVHQAGWEMVDVCVRKGGSLSGEHGVGIEKRQFMSLMFNGAELSALQNIKQVFDPHNLLNPGKLFPSQMPEVRGVPRAVGKGKADDGRRAEASEPRGKADDGRRAEASSALTNDAGAASRLVGAELASALPSPLIPLSLPSALFPASTEEAAQQLKALATAGRRVRITGAEEARESESGEDMVLSTAKLSGIKTYALNDLYVTVGAGMRLSELQAFLAADRKQVPLVSPWPEATIGGLVAANVNAPLRMRYGSLRDLVLCATVVLGDGRVIRAGRPIVKNVAGFDLPKVFAGSYGTLGLLTDITLKITPLPRTRRTLLVPVADLRHGLIWARQLLPLALVASAIVLSKGDSLLDMPGLPASPYLLTYTAEGLPEDVETELDAVCHLLQAAGAPPPLAVETSTGTDLWADLLRGAPRQALQARIGVPIRDLPSYVQDQSHLLNEGSFLADIANGLIYAVKTPDDVEEARTWLEGLRQPALAAEGYAIAMNVPAALQGTIDPWGYRPPALDIMQKLKARWDPAAILNPGMFVVESK